MENVTHTADFDLIMKMLYAIHDTIDMYEITATAEKSYTEFSQFDFQKRMTELEDNQNYYYVGTEIKISITRIESAKTYTKCCIEFVN